MSQTTLETIQVIVGEQLGIDPVRVIPTASFTGDLGADSLDVVELVMAIEERFEIEINDVAAAEINIVQDVLDYLAGLEKN